MAVFSNWHAPVGTDAAAEWNGSDSEFAGWLRCWGRGSCYWFFRWWLCWLKPPSVWAVLHEWGIWEKRARQRCRQQQRCISQCLSTVIALSSPWLLGRRCWAEFTLPSIPRGQVTSKGHTASRWHCQPWSSPSAWLRATATASPSML